jgi:predicted amidohydrolase
MLRPALPGPSRREGAVAVADHVGDLARALVDPPEHERSDRDVPHAGVVRLDAHVRLDARRRADRRPMSHVAASGRRHAPTEGTGMVRVAAYQAPLTATRSHDVLGLLAEQVARCEAAGVEILCCPEAVVGGLADYVAPAHRRVLPTDAVALADALAPLASATVTAIVGYTEGDAAGRLFNAAVVLRGGAVVGRYRKLHPAIRRSVYTAGAETPVFTVGALTFGILLCRDSVFAEPARRMVARGAAALFVPTNNGLPADRPHARIAAHARRLDVERATAYGVSVIRADVAGAAGGLVSRGSTGIVGPDARVLADATPLEGCLVTADIPLVRRARVPAAGCLAHRSR